MSMKEENSTLDMVRYLRERNKELEEKVDFLLWYFVEEDVPSTPKISKEYTKRLFENYRKSHIGKRK